MTALGRRRRPAHRVSRRRRGPLLAIIAGVLLLVVSVPVAMALSDRDDHDTTRRTGAPTTTTTRTAPTSGPSTTGSTSTPIRRGPPGVNLRVVPALRDVQVKVDGVDHTTDKAGVIRVPNARGSVAVTFLGYSVNPPLQQVDFRSWSDGSTALMRQLDADGRGNVAVLVDLRYRVTTYQLTGGRSDPVKLAATSPVGTVMFTNGVPRWVLARRGQVAGSRLEVRSFTYTITAKSGASSKPQRFVPSPEDTWVVRRD